MIPFMPSISVDTEKLEHPQADIVGNEARVAVCTLAIYRMLSIGMTGSASQNFSRIQTLAYPGSA